MFQIADVRLDSALQWPQSVAVPSAWRSSHEAKPVWDRGFGVVLALPPVGGDVWMALELEDPDWWGAGGC